MSDKQIGEEIVAICPNCNAVYPAIRLPDGKIRRKGRHPHCQCGIKPLVEIESK